jgi:hypothetical protein
VTPELAYFAFGATLVAALAAIWIFYFARRRRQRVEAPKHRMMEDDDGF